MLSFSSQGSGPKLLLIHGLGSTRRAWSPILAALAAHREVITLDLPGHGESPAEADSGTFAGLARSVRAFVTDQGLTGLDMVGSSLGGRLVLELARTGEAGSVVALDPGGFWRGWERTFFSSTISASVNLLRLARPALPALAGNPLTRSALLVQLSARPWGLDPKLVASELASFVSTPTFAALVADLAAGPEQEGPAAPTTGKVVIGWGNQDRLCIPVQAKRAQAAFPSSSLHWFMGSGHFPMWDQPVETAQVILDATGGRWR
ncbi:MAG: Putative hydrolase [uncultured Sphingomonas sp.]|uniref:Hydrolase n=1 Tax=uncultured Sphingomonas sp. TaxID=158754 RepID=A0A6J4TSQ8_9SPHN|nr:MAG: Putative hydrolase [uncultured Sphingomonas sp.]